MRVEGGIGVGGVRGALGVMRAYDCPHGLPLCAGAYASAEIFRAAFDSSWRHRSYAGVDVGAHLFPVRIAFGALVPVDEGSPVYWRIRVGLGF